MNICPLYCLRSSQDPVEGLVVHNLTGPYQVEVGTQSRSLSEVCQVNLTDDAKYYPSLSSSLFTIQERDTMLLMSYSKLPKMEPTNRHWTTHML